MLIKTSAAAFTGLSLWLFSTPQLANAYRYHGSAVLFSSAGLVVEFAWKLQAQQSEGESFNCNARHQATSTFSKVRAIPQTGLHALSEAPARCAESF